MRWIISVLIIVVFAACSWFAFNFYQENETVDPLSLLEANTHLVIRMESGNAITELLTDTAFNYRFLFKTLGLDSIHLQDVRLISSLQNPFILASCPDGTIQIIAVSGLDSVASKVSGFGLTVEHNLQVLSSNQSLPNYLSATELAQLKKAEESFIGTSKFRVLFKPSAIKGFLNQTFNAELSTLLLSQLESPSWCAIEGGNENQRLVLNGISAKKESTEFLSKQSDLLRFIPSKTGLTVFDNYGTTPYSISYINYNQTSESGEDNVFVMIESAEDNSIVASNDYHGIGIRLKPIPSPDSLWFRPTWANEAFEARMGDVSIYAASFQQISKLIDDYLADNKLESSAYYTKLEDLTSNADFSLYYNPNRVQQPNPFFKVETKVGSDLNAMVFQTFSELPTQNFYMIGALHGTEIIEKAPILWELKIDTLVEGGPWLFQNHYTKEPEILVQDNKHQLYCINNQGKVLWQKKLEEQIIDDVSYIDGFNTGKYQMLFTTKSAVHLIDRNGKYVEKYPIQLTNQTTMAASALKYSSKGEYRILAMNGTKLMNLNTVGDRVDGWNDPDLKSPLLKPVILYQAGGKDYLIAQTEDHRIHFLDRAGSKRKAAILADSAMQFAGFRSGESLSSSYFVGFDSIGNIYNLSFSGELKKENVLPFGSDLGFASVKNNEIEYLSIKGDHLIGLNKKLDVLLDFNFPEKMEAKIQILNHEKTWIAVSSRSKRNIYIFDLNESLLDKMPLQGGGKCLIADLNLNSIPELVVIKNEHTLVAYKLTN